MTLKVYDFRNDEHICQMLVSPEIRCRFMRAEPGTVQTVQHSHDLGHEVFLILQGRCEFHISGETAVLGPGQLCLALADEPHRIRVVGDEPVIMYLSVTPHIQPTHTSRNDDGSRHPLRFAPSSSYEVETDSATPAPELVDGFVAASAEFARTARAAADRQAEAAVELKAALAAADWDKVEELRNQLWEGVYRGYKEIFALGDLWNTVAPRISRFDGE